MLNFQSCLVETILKLKPVLDSDDDEEDDTDDDEACMRDNDDAGDVGVDLSSAEASFVVGGDCKGK